MDQQTFSTTTCKEIFAPTFRPEVPMVVDGGGLGLLASQPSVSKRDNRILTPHPGEAGQLLQTR